MHRRELLRTGVAIGTVGLAGCLDVLETQSAWRDPPIVENRPDAPYVPASTEEMRTYGVAEVGDYAVSLSYTFPHRFWTITGRETNRVEVRDEDTLHLMASVWDVETGTVLPTDVRMTVEGNGAAPYGGQLWPMLAQRMGFHYGDNLAIDEDGTYAATLRITPVSARLTGDLEGRFEEPATAEIEFEYASDDVYDLEFSMIDEERRGEPGELELMDHFGHAEGGHGSPGGHADQDPDAGGGHQMPAPTCPAAEEFPGEVVGTGESGGAAFVVATLEDERFGEGVHLAVSPRTPENRTMLPLMSLSATVERDGEAILEKPLESTLDPELGFHYGTTLALALRSGDDVTIGIDSVPQAARHDGYETAFTEMPPVKLTVE